MNIQLGVSPIFIFYPEINGRSWRVLVSGGKKTEFAKEGQAVAFAMSSAETLKRRGRAVKVFKESLAGHWVQLPIPVSSTQLPLGG
ncbi:hypothetical protein KR767_17225 [Luteibacter anthropi]|uniref:hypothetical protein n=1 Tax=Luteibacter anthropi TaxID=564369 RepID=UPI0020328D6F|nr:hypothetical protein [Luteibacter anthropi]URX61779.1 hypothetical protein KR767_17225 [Luteibacter anthropi]